MADTTPADSVQPYALPENVGRRQETGSEQTIDVEQPAPALQKLEESPPDGGYGWVCVACNFWINGKRQTFLSLPILHPNSPIFIEANPR